jgi:hypothetical protein
MPCREHAFTAQQRGLSAHVVVIQKAGVDYDLGASFGGAGLAWATYRDHQKERQKKRALATKAAVAEKRQNWSSRC